MAGINSKAMGRSVSENLQDWHNHYNKTVHGYLCRPFSHWKAPIELLYGSQHAYPRDRWQVIEP